MKGQNGFTSFMKQYESNAESGAEGTDLFRSNTSTESYFTDFFATAQESLTEGSNQFSEYFGIKKTADIEQGLGDSADNTWNEISRSDRFKYFVGFLFVSLFFFTLSTFFFPMVLVVPQKFVFCYTLGSLSFMSAFAMIQGPSDFAKGLLEKERLPFTIAYFSSIVGTLYTCLFWKTYLGILFFSWIQILSLGWYAATYLPGGRTGLRIICRVVKSVFSNGCVPFFKMTITCFKKLFN